jgi:hypothetical protein
LGVITNWLYKTFRKDEEQWKLSVMALFNRSESVFWELMQSEVLKIGGVMSGVHAQLVLWWFFLSTLYRMFN